ncbi:MAG: hypothetical protein ACTHOD_13225 [Motilibacteraceae bacterium]
MPALPDVPPPSGTPSRPFRLRTDRLLLLPLLGPHALLDGGDGEDVLLDAVVSVVLSNPAFLATHEGSDGEVHLTVTSDHDHEGLMTQKRHQPFMITGRDCYRMIPVCPRE